MKLTASALVPLLAVLAAASPTTINTARFEEVALIPADNNSNNNNNNATATPPPLVERNSGQAGIYYCRNAGWQAPCAHTVLRIGQCMNFPTGWDNNIRSFGPDPGPHYCVLHSRPGCGGGEPKFRLRYPGIRNTMEVGQQNQASSVRCSY